MIRFLMRPTIFQFPAASTSPWSPVWNQPSRSAFAVSSARSQYPGKIFGPRTTISLFSASFISTPEIAGPVHPAVTGVSGSSMVQIAVVSVRP